MLSNPPISSAKEKLLAIGWGFKLAWRIDKKSILFWYSIRILLSILPALILSYNRSIISEISTFLSTGVGNFSYVAPTIIIFGVFMTVSGLSTRINGDLLYYIMYDSYYLGMEEVLIQKSNKISPDTLLNKEIKDEFSAVVTRAGSLAALICGSCMLISHFVSLLSILVIAIPISWVISVIAIVYIAITIMLKMKSINKTRSAGFLRNADERFVAHYQNLPLNPDIAKEVRIYESQQDILEQWGHARNKIDIQEKHRLSLREKYSLIGSIGFICFTSGTLIHSLINVSRGLVAPDVFLLMYSLCFSISNIIKNVTSCISQFDYGLFSIERQRKFILNVPEMEYKKDIVIPDAKEATTVIELKNVSFGYKPGISVLKNINLKINRGETIALVGYNGCGKTTLANLIVNRYQPNEGTLFLNEVAYSEYPEGGIEENIGIFFQNYYLFHASIRDNIAWGDIKNYHNDEKIDESMKAASIDRLLDKLCVDDEKWVHKAIIQNSINLSGGESQRLALGRTYMSERPILIFDEPASALDPIAEMEQFYSIKNQLKERTNILISHRIGFARLADRIIVMKGGEIIEDGTHDDLMKATGLYAYLYNEQAQWYDKTAGVTQ